MNTGRSEIERAFGERKDWDKGVHDDAERGRSQVADQDDGEDWPLLTALLGGLALAVLANTWISLIPG